MAEHNDKVLASFIIAIDTYLGALKNQPAGVLNLMEVGLKAVLTVDDPELQRHVYAITDALQGLHNSNLQHSINISEALRAIEKRLNQQPVKPKEALKDHDDKPSA